MSITITHRFPCPGADNPATPNVVRPSNWNEQHNIVITGDDIIHEDRLTKGIYWRAYVSGGSLEWEQVAYNSVSGLWEAV